MAARKEHPLDHYVGRGEISTDQHRAGLRLSRDYLAARKRSSVGKTEHQLAYISTMLNARTRCRAALLAVGPVLAPVLLHVVCLEETAASWAESIGRSDVEGQVTLRLALDALAIHYGLIVPTPGKTTSWLIET